MLTLNPSNPNPTARLPPPPTACIATALFITFDSVNEVSVFSNRQIEQSLNLSLPLPLAPLCLPWSSPGVILVLNAFWAVAAVVALVSLSYQFFFKSPLNPNIAAFIFFTPNWVLKLKVMPRYKDEPAAVQIYTVSDESKYLIVRNVPALGCGDELLRLFSTYGRVEECKPMDAEDCEPFTDVYWIKFYQVNNSRFAKRKLDNFVFLGNMLQVSYAPQYESLSDTTEKLEWRRKEVIARLNPRRSKGATNFNQEVAEDEPIEQSNFNCKSHAVENASGNVEETPLAPVSTDTNYFSSQSMNQTLQLVREKLNKIRSSGEQIEVGASKRSRTDTWRRI